MKCKDIQVELAVYFDDILSANDLERVDAHLAVCPLCRGKLAEFHENRNTLRSATPIIISQSLVANIRTAVDRSLGISASAPVFDLVEDRRTWREAWLFPSLVGSFASIVFSVSLLWLILSPVERQEFAARTERPSTTYLANTSLGGANSLDLSPLEFANTRLSVSGESPSVNPQGALIALSRSLIRGEMKDDEVVIVADVFGNGLARIAEVVEPKQDDNTILELRKAFQEPSFNSPFVPASMDRRGESVRVVLKFQTVDVPVENPGL